MEATSKYRRYKKSVFSPTISTSMHGDCYACKNISSSQPSGETKASCKGCCCFLCNVCNAKVDCGIDCPVKKIGTKLLRLGHLDKSNRNGNLLAKSSSPSIALSSALPIRHNKRAVLCGVSYTKRKFRLKGTINDISNMKELLVKNFKFPIECIRVLTEQEKNVNLIPTKHNILESLRWLVKDCEAGDSLVFYFSGHGLQQPDFKEDETDGFDETLCPVDFIKEGMIIDNEINSTIVWPLKKGVKLHAIVDACHSGTILDLLYVYNYKRGIWEDNKPPSREPMRKHTNGGVAICLSACEDSQTATDSTVRILSVFLHNKDYVLIDSVKKVFGGKGMNGVLTYLLTKTIRECPGITYGSLLGKIHDELIKINRSRCNNRILQHIFQRKIAQDPLLSSSEKFDVSTTIFKL